MRCSDEHTNTSTIIEKKGMYIDDNGYGDGKLKKEPQTFAIVLEKGWEKSRGSILRVKF